MIPSYIPKRLKERIGHWDDERNVGNSLIITLVPGFWFPSVECHTIGVDTINQAIKELRESALCYCDDCKRFRTGRLPGSIN